MFNHTKRIGIVSIIALALTTGMPAQQLGVGDTDLDVGPTAAAQQMDGSANQRRGVDLGRAQRVVAKVVVLADNVVPGTPWILFIGTGPNSPVLLLEAGIVPEVGALALNMHIGLHHDSIMGVYFKNGETTIVCPKGPSDLVKPKQRFGYLVTDQDLGLAFADRRSEPSSGDQGLGVAFQGAVQGSTGETLVDSRVPEEGSQLVKPSPDLWLFVTDQGTALLLQGVVVNGNQGLGMVGKAAAKGTDVTTRRPTRPGGPRG